MPPESVFEFPMMPTPPVAVMPGIRFCRPSAFLEEGIAEMMSLVMICCVRALCTSTIGVSPVTVIVSSSAPTLKSAFTVATKFPDSSIPSTWPPDPFSGVVIEPILLTAAWPLRLG